MSDQMKIMVIQGPNINMLGRREVGLYGMMSMKEIHEQMKKVADQAGVGIDFFQSNFEGEIVDKIQECLGEFDGIIINPAAYSHTSIAIRDAILAVNLPTIEVHISNISQREGFRSKSITAEVCAGQIIGFGPVGYHLSMVAMLQIFEQIKIAMQNAQNKENNA